MYITYQFFVHVILA